MEALQQQLLITEDKIVTPLIEVLNETIPKPTAPLSSNDISIPLRKSLDDLFPEQQYEEKNIQRAKDILGEVSGKFTPAEFKVAITEVQFLAESWLDNFEREIFGGLTLQELLHEKGGR
jgi:hypothetical protein